MTILEDDRAFRLGDGLFETVLVTAQGPVALSWHLERFQRSAVALAFPRRSIDAGLAALAALEKGEPGVWRVTVSRDDPEAVLGGSGCVAVARRDVVPAQRPRLQSAVGWHFPGYFLAEHKTTSYVRNVEARRRAVAAGFDDALLISNDGDAGEASTANVFVRLADDSIVTPAVDGLLPGTARGRILAGQSVLGVVIEERRVRHDELRSAREVVLTNAVVGAVSAASLDGVSLASELGEKFRAFLLGRR